MSRLHNLLLVHAPGYVVGRRYAGDFFNREENMSLLHTLLVRPLHNLLNQL